MHGPLCCIQELDSCERQWTDASSQIDKLDKFFPISSTSIARAEKVQAAQIERGQPYAQPTLADVTALAALQCR